MSQRHISGKDFYITVGVFLIQVESATLTITDERTTVKTGGVPNGYVDGDVSAAGEIELDSTYFMILNEAARAAGSWKELDQFDMNFAAIGSMAGVAVQAFGCMLKISDLLNIDPAGKEKHKYKLPFEVTDKDFIKINGVPYLSKLETIDVV
jgi:hypothetical protein